MIYITPYVWESRGEDPHDQPLINKLKPINRISNQASIRNLHEKEICLNALKRLILVVIDI